MRSHANFCGKLRTVRKPDDRCRKVAVDKVNDDSPQRRWLVRAKRSSKCIAVWVGMAAAAWFTPAWAATPVTPTPTPLTIVGNKEIVWAFRAVPADADSSPLLQFAYAVASPKNLRFRRLPIAPSGGEIVRSAIVRNQLHVFFSDGTHYRFRPPPGSPSPDRMGKNDFPEVNLPNNQVPAALAGDSKTETLYAVVPVEIARWLTPAIEEPEDVTTNAIAPPVKDKAPVALLADASSNGVVRYAGNAWEIVCGIPAFLDDGRVCGLAAHENVVHLLFGEAEAEAEAEAGAKLRYSTWSPVRSKWSPPTTVPGVLADDVLSLVLIEGKPTLLVRVSATEANTFNLLAISLLDGEWRPQAELTIDGHPLVFPGSSVAAHRFGDQIAVAVTEVGAEEATETVRIGFWPAAGGDPTTAPVEAVALLQGPDEEEAEQLRTLAATVVLALTMTVVVMRRRESFLVDAVLPPGFRLARLSRRLVAMLVDVVAVSVLVSPLIVAPWLQANGIALTDDVQAEVQWLLARDPGAVFWLWIKVAIAFMLYGIAFEATVAATPGKLLFGLRVFNAKGERASFFAILLRNMLRLEMYYPGFQFAPIGILAAITRNRQRLGDLLARTVVMERSPETPTPQA